MADAQPPVEQQPAEDKGPSKSELKKKAKAEEKEKKKAERAAQQAAAAKQKEDAEIVSVHSMFGRTHIS
jgi:aspartyl-tRNA synthetase